MNKKTNSLIPILNPIILFIYFIYLYLFKIAYKPVKDYFMPQQTS